MKKLSLISLLAVLVIACGSKENPEQGPTSLDKPTGLSAVTTETSASISWSAVSGAQGYTYRLTQSGKQVKNGTALQNQVVIDGLSAGTTYLFQVYATAGTVKSSYSDALEVKTQNASGGGGGGGADAPAYADFQIPADEENLGALAFPGAEGCGMFTTGGRGGKVIHVTNLNDSGTGSLRAALAESGTRTIVFDVAGRIKLQSLLQIKNGNVTIAGQTAPGDGICLSDYSVAIDADNVIIRYLRFRMGDEAAKAYKATFTEEEWAKKSDMPWQLEDCISGTDHSDIIIDHCSMSWCVDEAASFYDNDRFTMQYCIIAESMNHSVHPKGNHGYAGIWGGHGATFSHNLIAHHTSRTPRLCGSRYTGKPENEKAELVNNVFYNWGPTNGGYAGEGGSFNFINNYYKPGPSTATKSTIVNRIFAPDPDNGSNKNAKDTWGSFWLEGNRFDTGCANLSSSQVTICENVNNDNWVGLQPSSASYPASLKASSAFDISYNGSRVKKQSASDAYATVLASAGASLKRDSVDERIVNEVQTGTAAKGNKGIIDSQDQVGGWPAYSGETQSAFPGWVGDPNAKTLDPKGRYTNLEMYLHYLTVSNKE